MYCVYILKCADETLYTGIAIDLEKRLNEHNCSELGAKYTRYRRPVQLVYAKKFRDRSTATKEEMRIKTLAREEKLKMIKKHTPYASRPTPLPPKADRQEGNKKHKE
ncbi:GIY-YIG nuclease family protein [Candidatus Parcubacteria bacterium]|nr:GIY-YIG nuclease family protein [Candidatus Parcubacteria bacterium]